MSATATRPGTRLRKAVVTALAVTMLVTGLAPAAYAKRGKAGKGGIGIDISRCDTTSVCNNVGTGNGAGGKAGKG